MGSNIFKSYLRTDSKLKESGYIKAFLNLADDFTTLNEPAPLDVDSVTGDSTIITTPHVWAVGKGPMSLYINKKSLEAPAELVGDAGSQKFKWTVKCFLIGDGPVAQDLAQSLINQDLVVFVQDQCQNGDILQYGCDCLTANIVKGSFASGTLEAGSKGWSFEIESYCRYFYRGGALTPRT